MNKLSLTMLFLAVSLLGMKSLHANETQLLISSSDLSQLKDFSKESEAPLALNLTSNLGQTYRFICQEKYPISQDSQIITKGEKKEVLSTVSTHSVLDSNRFRNYSCFESTQNKAVITVLKSEKDQIELSAFVQLGSTHFISEKSEDQGGLRLNSYTMDGPLPECGHQDFNVEQYAQEYNIQNGTNYFVSEEPAAAENIAYQVEESYVAYFDAIFNHWSYKNINPDLFHADGRMMRDDNSLRTGRIRITYFLSHFLTVANLIFQRDANLSLKVQNLYVETTTRWLDNRDIHNLKDEFGGYGNGNPGRRAFAALLFGQQTAGGNGKATIDSLCSNFDLGYMVARVTTAQPFLFHGEAIQLARRNMENLPAGDIHNYYTQLLTFTHEVGHIIGAEHTWEYNPDPECCSDKRVYKSLFGNYPDERARACLAAKADEISELTDWNGENVNALTPDELDRYTSTGSIMSYCGHRSLSFSSRVRQNLRSELRANSNGDEGRCVDFSQFLAPQITTFEVLRVLNAAQEGGDRAYEIRVDLNEHPEAQRSLYFVWTLYNSEGDIVFTENTFVQRFNAFAHMIPVPAQGNYRLELQVFDENGIASAPAELRFNHGANPIEHFGPDRHIFADEDNPASAYFQVGERVSFSLVFDQEAFQNFGPEIDLLINFGDGHEDRRLIRRDDHPNRLVQIFHQYQREGQFNISLDMRSANIRASYRYPRQILVFTTPQVRDVLLRDMTGDSERLIEGDRLLVDLNFEDANVNENHTVTLILNDQALNMLIDHEPGETARRAYVGTVINNAGDLIYKFRIVDSIGHAIMTDPVTIQVGRSASPHEISEFYYTNRINRSIEPDVYAGEFITLKAEIYDADMSDDQDYLISFFHNGSPILENAVVDSSRLLQGSDSVRQFEFQTEALEEGPHTFMIEVTDSEGNDFVESFFFMNVLNPEMSFDYIRHLLYANSGQEFQLSFRVNHEAASDSMRVWVDYGDGSRKQRLNFDSEEMLEEIVLDYQYSKAGIYNIQIEVEDGEGRRILSTPSRINVRQSFFFGF